MGALLFAYHLWQGPGTMWQRCGIRCGVPKLARLQRSYYLYPTSPLLNYYITYTYIHTTIKKVPLLEITNPRNDVVVGSGEQNWLDHADSALHNVPQRVETRQNSLSSTLAVYLYGTS